MKRALCLAVLTVGLMGRRSLADAPSEDAPGGRANMDAHWATLDECLDDVARALDARAASEGRAVEESACSEAARPIVEDGTDTDRERLWSAFDALPDDSPLAGEVVDMFLERRVELSLAPFQGKTTSPAITPPDHAAPPALLQSAPDELQEAWRLYASVMQAPEKRPDTSSAEPVIAFRANEPAFRRAVVAFLRGRISPADIVREMSRFEWVGRCGTGSDVFYGPKVKVLVVAHLQLGRSDLALAAAKHGGFMGMDQTGLSADPRLLTAAGLDWERFHLGGVLSGHLDSSRPLALRGSNRAAGFLLTYARMLNGAGDEAPNPALEWLLSTLAAFVEPGEGAEGLAARTDSRAARAADAEPIGGEVQQGVLELLATQFEPNASAWESTTAADVLVELARPESRPAFQAMLRSPYEGVRKQGAAGLRALGETVADPLPSRPVAFRLVVDGRPLRRADLSVLLETEGGGSDSSGAYTDDAGIVELERDPFVDPRRRLVSIHLDVRGDSVEREWFEIKPESLPDLDTVTTVSIRTGAVTVVIPPSLLDGSPPPTLTVLAVRDGDREKAEGEDFEATPIAVDLPVASTVVGLHLQHGRYRVRLDRGAAIYESPVVEVGPKPVTTTVDVDPIYGTDDEPEERAASPTNQPL